MNYKQITNAIFALHANVSNLQYFEGFWPIPYGVSINCYLIRGEKNALIDLYGNFDACHEIIHKQLEALNVPLHKIDYLIINHLESDHTGFIQNFRKENPNAQIVSTAKGIDLLINFCKLDETNLRIVKTGDSLDLGNNLTLQFFETPFIHWPETMMTYCPQHKILFSCDAFGGFGKLVEDEAENLIFDDEYSPTALTFYKHEILRYYATIVASFSQFVQKALVQLQNLPIQVVAPSHGIIWRKNPQTIIEYYQELSSYNTTGPLKNEICVICGSMYGNTEEGVQEMLKVLHEEKIPYTSIVLPENDISRILAVAYAAKGLIIAMPTYEYKMFPPMAYILTLFRYKHFKNKITLRIGSKGWSGGAEKDYQETIKTLNWKQLESYEWQGVLSDSDKENLRKKTLELVKEIKNSSIK